jgi:hypothetical protein
VSGRPPFEIVAEDDLRSISGPDFALVFRKLGDRWTHALEVSRSLDGPRETIARAVEWDAERDDPERVASPIFQELQFQADTHGSPRAFLLGMSGRHHFSAVFSLKDESTGVEIHVDLADRCRDEVLAIGSTYTVMLRSGELRAADETAIDWDLGTSSLKFGARASTRVGMAEAGRTATRVQALASSVRDHPTRRWSYAWSISASARRA